MGDGWAQISADFLHFLDFPCKLHFHLGISIFAQFRVSAPQTPLSLMAVQWLSVEQLTRCSLVEQTAVIPGAIHVHNLKWHMLQHHWSRLFLT